MSLLYENLAIEENSVPLNSVDSLYFSKQYVLSSPLIFLNSKNLSVIIWEGWVGDSNPKIPTLSIQLNNGKLATNKTYFGEQDIKKAKLNILYEFASLELEFEKLKKDNNNWLKRNYL
jgi:hypothetical protein